MGTVCSKIGVLLFPNTVCYTLFGTQQQMYVIKLKTHFPLLVVTCAGWFCGADLYNEHRPSPAAGTAAEAGKEMSARLWDLSV